MCSFSCFLQSSCRRGGASCLFLLFLWYGRLGACCSSREAAAAKDAGVPAAGDHCLCAGDGRKLVCKVLSACCCICAAPTLTERRRAAQVLHARLPLLCFNTCLKGPSLPRAAQVLRTLSPCWPCLEPCLMASSPAPRCAGAARAGPAAPRRRGSAGIAGGGGRAIQGISAGGGGSIRGHPWCGFR